MKALSSLVLAKSSCICEGEGRVRGGGGEGEGRDGWPVRRLLHEKGVGSCR